MNMLEEKPFTARNTSEQWLRDNTYNWMTEDQWECFEMLCDLCKGSHHVGGKVKPCGVGIEINIRYGFHASTFDYNGLTEAVILAHDRCIRFEIEPSGPGMMKLKFHKRHYREGRMDERHPTLEDAITQIRGNYKHG